MFKNPFEEPEVPDFWDMEACDCSCHRKGSFAIHVVPCCQKCPHCGKNVALDFDGHLRFCHEKMVAQRQKEFK